VNVFDVFLPAGPREIYVCKRCGRRSHDRAGHRKLHKGWDESCTLNAVRCRVDDLVIAPKSGIVTGFKPGRSAIPVPLN